VTSWCNQIGAMARSRSVVRDLTALHKGVVCISPPTQRKTDAV